MSVEVVTKPYEELLKVGQEVKVLRGGSDGNGKRMEGGVYIKDIVPGYCILTKDEQVLNGLFPLEKVFKWTTPIVPGKTRFKMGEEFYDVADVSDEKVTLVNGSMKRALSYFMLMERDECVMLPPMNQAASSTQEQSIIDAKYSKAKDTRALAQLIPSEIKTDIGAEVLAANLAATIETAQVSNVNPPETASVLRLNGVAVIQGFIGEANRQSGLGIAKELLTNGIGGLDSSLSARNMLLNLDKELNEKGKSKRHRITAAACRLLRGPDGRLNLVTTNSGDARILVVRGGRVIYLTKDHFGQLVNMDMAKALDIQHQLGTYTDGNRLNKELSEVLNLRFQLRGLGERALDERGFIPTIEPVIDSGNFAIQADDVVIIATREINILTEAEIINTVKEANGVKLSSKLATLVNARKLQIWEESRKEAQDRTTVNVFDRSLFEAQLQRVLGGTRFLNSGGVEVGTMIIKRR